MIEEQSHLMLHWHLLVWSYGYNDFPTFHTLMDKSPEKYNKLARFLEQIIFHKVAVLVHVDLALHGHDQPTAECTAHQDTEHARTLLELDANEQLAQPPPGECFPRHDVDRCLLHDASFARLVYLNLADITPAQVPGHLPQVQQ